MRIVCQSRLTGASSKCGSAALDTLGDRGLGREARAVLQVAAIVSGESQQTSAGRASPTMLTAGRPSRLETGRLDLYRSSAVVDA
jgi:hypothetical protein